MVSLKGTPCLGGMDPAPWPGPPPPPPTTASVLWRHTWPRLFMSACEKWLQKAIQRFEWWMVMPRVVLGSCKMKEDLPYTRDCRLSTLQTVTGTVIGNVVNTDGKWFKFISEPKLFKGNTKLGTLLAVAHQHLCQLPTLPLYRDAWREIKCRRQIPNTYATVLILSGCSLQYQCSW